MSATVATTIKPAIKAANLSVENCGINKYSDIDLEERIIGGYEAKVGRWPWLVRRGFVEKADYRQKKKWK